MEKERKGMLAYICKIVSGLFDVKVHAVEFDDTPFDPSELRIRIPPDCMETCERCKELYCRAHVSACQGCAS